MNPKHRSTQVSPARWVTFEILRRVEADGAYPSALIAALPESDLSREDRALAHEIILGVLRWKLSLDYFIERYSERPVDRFDLPVLIALRIGLYQLRYLTRIPQSAAVNESVNLVKHARAASAAGLVNAVLRKASRHLDETAGHDISEPVYRASVELSHPQWMIRRWQATLGDDETRALALANNTPPSTAFRINTLHSTADEVLALFKTEGLESRESEFSPGAFVVESGPAAAVNHAAQRGLIYLQDEASQLVSVLLKPARADRILDLCAAPGSKATHIAALADDKAWIVACDLHPHRLATLRASCQRLGITSVDPLALDATAALPFVAAIERFDRVLVDAPCSGTGTLRSNPDIKWRLKPEDISRLADLQLSLLERAGTVVAVKGRLVYSTCSIEPEENEAVVREFLAGNSSFQPVPPNVNADVISGDGFIRTFPHRHGCDGFFAAVLERTR